MKIKIYLLSVLASLSAMALQAQTPDYGLPEKIQDGNILHCFNWNVNDIKAELPAIARAGFGAVQVSPIQGNANSGAEWYYCYMPYDLALKSTGVGMRSQLRLLCEEAEKYGIKIIVDVVANHINGDAAYRDAKWNNTEYWHSASFKSINYGNRNSITHDNLGQYPDLNSEHAFVQQCAVSYIETLRDLGVKGIRWDAAKHIGLPSEDCNFWPAVTAVEGLWHYGEILDSPGGNEKNVLSEYTGYMSVTDNRYSNTLLNGARYGYGVSSAGQYTAQGHPADKLVYWGESHDTYANNGGATKNLDQAVIDRAWALGACRQGATALYLSRPFETAYKNIRVGVKGSTHFTASEIAAVNRLRNAMGNSGESLANANGVTVVTRAAGGACIVIGKGGSADVTVANAGGYVPAGQYSDLVDGGTFTVTPTTISGHVGDSGIAVIMDNSAAIISPSAATGDSTPEQYYTLDGRRTDRPVQPGIYIVRKGAQTIKQYVR